MDIIQRAITERQRELHRLADILSKSATRYKRSGAFAQVVTIVLGAFASTQTLAAKILNGLDITMQVTYVMGGLIIAAVGGIQAAFKFDSKAGELTVLAAHAQSTLWITDSQWVKSVGTKEGQEKIDAARQLLD